MPKFTGSFAVPAVEQTIEIDNQVSQSRTWAADGYINTLRDERGNLIQYENQDTASANAESVNQYIAFDFTQKQYDSTEIEKVIDMGVSELFAKSDVTNKIDRFFSLFENLVFQIPVQGQSNSLNFLLRRLSEITDNEIIDPNQFTQISGTLGTLRDRFDALSDLLSDLTNDSSSLVYRNDTLLQQVTTLGNIILDNLTGQKITVEELLNLLNAQAGRIVSTPVVFVEAGEPYEYTVVSNTPIVNWKLDSGPSWLSLQTISDTQAKLSGTPTSNDLGETVVSVRALSPTNTIFQTYELEVVEAGGLPGGGGTTTGYQVSLRALISDPPATSANELFPEVDYTLSDENGNTINAQAGGTTPIRVKGIPYNGQITFLAKEKTRTISNKPPNPPVVVTLIPVKWVSVSPSGVVTTLQERPVGSYEFVIDEIDTDYELYVIYREGF